MYFDLVALIDFEILKHAYASFGIQYSTFYSGVFSARHMNGKSRTVCILLHLARKRAMIP